MEVIHPRCAGLDVHKRTVSACAMVHDGSEAVSEIRKFDTRTASLLELSDWLTGLGITHVAMESTGVYWEPVFNILEGNFSVWVVNARHLQSVPGNKTDSRDASWIATCHMHGLLRPSFIPGAEQRDLRDLTRERQNFVRERINLVNRLQKILEKGNIKLASVVSDVMGRSGRAMIDALIEGRSGPAEMSELAVGLLRAKRGELELALEGRLRPVHRIILSHLIAQITGVDETLGELDKAIDEACRPFDEAARRLETIPGFSRRVAQTVVSEIGADMGRFPTAGHLAAWAGVAPGNKESGGRRLSGAKRQGNKRLCAILVQAAHCASRTNTYLRAHYARIKSRRGGKRAVIAVAHTLLVACWHMISRNEDFKDLGSDYFEKRQPQKVAEMLVRRLKAMGLEVTVTAKTQPAAA